MNAKELRDLFASGRAYVACDGERLIDEATAREADAIAARALGLLAAAERNDGSTPETDADVFDRNAARPGFPEHLVVDAEISRGIERERTGLAARVTDLEIQLEGEHASAEDRRE